MKDLQKLVGSLNKSGALSGFLGGVAGGGLSGLATSKSGKKTSKKVVKYGALAAIGGLAWKAYQQYAQKSSAAEPSTAHPRSGNFNYHSTPMQQQSFEHVVEDDNEGGQLLLMRAMIAAAYADGHIDEQERQRIFAQVENMDLQTHEKAMLFDELRQPMSLSELVNAVPNVQTGIEVYAASASAIDLSQPISGQYLDALANKLCIPQELVNNVHQQLTQQARLASE